MPCQSLYVGTRVSMPDQSIHAEVESPCRARVSMPRQSLHARPQCPCRARVSMPGRSSAVRALDKCLRSVMLGRSHCSIMPVVTEVRHPKSLDFANERKVLHLRDVHGCEWADICRQVVNLQGGAPSLSLVQRVHRAFNKRAGQRKYQYDRCGRKPFKVSAAVEKFIIKRLLALRLVSACTATTLRREVLRAKRGSGRVHRPEGPAQAWLSLAPSVSEAQVQCQAEEGARAFRARSFAVNEGVAP